MEGVLVGDRQAEIEQTLRAYLAIPPRVLADLEQSYMLRDSFVPGDPYKSAWQEGQRSVVLNILRMQAQARKL